MTRLEVHTFLQWICSLLLILQSVSLFGQVQGKIVDHHGHGLPGATVEIYPDSIYAVSDVDGRFVLSGVSDGNHTLITNYIGFVSDTTSVTVVSGATRRLRVELEVDAGILETVVVTDEHAKQEIVLQTDHVHHDFFARNLEGSFAKSLQKLPGINAINVGVGIAKPVIRGLSANRIIVNHQGVKQESQQWGNDHGLEIDQFDVERVEIIKGPGSLQYGSDGLGGVINIMPDQILPKGSYKGQIMGLYKTNNDHLGASAKVAVNIDDWFASARYSSQGFGDYQVPATSFTYNSFDLPILNNRLKNTAGQETNLSISAGVKSDRSITRLLYSHYSLDAGLFSGAVGAPRSYALSDDGNPRDIDVPSQMVDHYRLSLNQTFFFGKNHFVFDIGLQRNDREERSQPEFHSIPLSQLQDPNDKLAIGLLLQTVSFDSHVEINNEHGYKHIVGLNTQWQDNRRSGFEYLLPDFKTFRGGLYMITQKELSNHWLLSGGLRFDRGRNRTDRYRQFVWDSNENIVDSLVSLATDDDYYNWSGSLGSNIEVSDHWSLKINIGKSFRVPYPSETVSNGIHHGTFRHEVGTPDLKSEHGYQFDLGSQFEYNRFSGGIASYFNYFKDYIYLGPTFPARFSKLPEAGQIFQYRQDNAIYTGFEMYYDWKVSEHFAVHQAADFVQSFNPETRLALPFTPPPTVKSDLIYTFGDSERLTGIKVELSHEFVAAANGNLRIDRSERSTPSYHLFHVGVGGEVNIGSYVLEVNCKAQNIFDTEYLAHLSRYRIINVPEQGRNIVIAVSVPFEGSLTKKGI